MTLQELTKLLDAHDIIWEHFTSQSIKAFVTAFSDECDIFEVIGTMIHLNGSPDFNIWSWLGH